MHPIASVKVMHRMDPQELALKVPQQKIDFCHFSSLPELLKLLSPPFGSDHFRQLKLIERHVKNADPPCQSVIIERYYIDRDFMDEYSAFYSTNLYPYPNWCQRIHFFSLSKNELRKRIRDLARLATSAEANVEDQLEFRHECLEFSYEAYLGFSVIKPLHGSPVGRTVIRHYKEEAGKGQLRKFNCTRYYKVHLLGLELAVCGLVFQQQDVGVSACATTAVWSSLSKGREFEDILTPTPAQITRLATQYLAPSGRPMPSEGLTLEQMCQAVQSAQSSASVLRIENLTEARAYLHSAVSSGFAPILLLELVGPISLLHAVTVAGMKVSRAHKPTLIGDRIDDEAGDLVSLYVNDDRTSPYFRVDLPARGKRAVLKFKFLDDKKKLVRLEEWLLTHMLIPMHGKIRLSFAELREMAIDVIHFVQGYGEYFNHFVAPVEVGTIRLRTLILRSPAYVHHLFYGKKRIGDKQRDVFNQRIIQSRYVGIVRLTSERIGSFDVLFDTTSTKKNPHCLGVVARIPKEYFPRMVAEFLAAELRCPFVVDVQ
jgi:hypothetical protein